MQLVDTALAKRAADNRPIQVALFGAGFSARHIANQITRHVPGMRVAIVVNRTPEHARSILEQAGINDVQEISRAQHLDEMIKTGQQCIAHDPDIVFYSRNIDAIIETTGTIEYGAKVALGALSAHKHCIALNCELDATLGPYLQQIATQNNVIYSNSDGDEPGVAMNLSRFVTTLGLKVVGAGNLKTFYDRYRTPTTQREFAKAHNQNPKAVTSFVDGTKLSMETTVLANALGFGVRKRGMLGPQSKDVRFCLEDFPSDTFSTEDGVVDFLLGAAPNTGAFVIAYSEDPAQKAYLSYLKMGPGPFYVFHTPFHLPQLEVPITVARAVLFHDATVAPKGAPSCEAVTMAKRNLPAGTVLDGLGGYDCYALIERYSVGRAENLLPMGLAEGCTLRKEIEKDQAITFDDVILPGNRLIDSLYEKSVDLFSKYL